MLSVVDTAIHGQAAAAGRPVQISTGKASAAEAAICAVMASGGSALDLTPAFQAACSTAPSKAATTSVLSTQASSR